MDLSPHVQRHYHDVLKHLYINPLEKCNLRCKICYTRKTNPILSEEEILAFISKYEHAEKLSIVTFCGGEVFTLPYFPRLVNTLTEKGIFVQVITNGTVDTLDKFSDPNSVNLIVSLDGLPDYHDANRGEGNFLKSTAFLKKAQSLGFHTEVFSIVTRQNYKDLDEFERYLANLLGYRISVTYHPRKPPAYLVHHPISNIVGQVDGFDFLTPQEMRELLRNKKTFPPKELGCYQIALASDGKVYGCCEGTVPLGVMTDEVGQLFSQLKKRLILWESANALQNCLGCSQPDFVCGIKQYLT